MSFGLILRILSASTMAFSTLVVIRFLLPSRFNSVYAFVVIVSINIHILRCWTRIFYISVVKSGYLRDTIIAFILFCFYFVFIWHIGCECLVGKCLCCDNESKNYVPLLIPKLLINVYFLNNFISVIIYCNGYGGWKICKKLFI